MKYLDLTPNQILSFDAFGQRRVHQFDENSILAIQGALAAERPLLVRGEPGVGKSQLALAAAHALGRVFVSTVVDARTEARDLQFSLDAVERLARAQVISAVGAKTTEQVTALLDESEFITPGPLWWAFDFARAKTQAARVGGHVPSAPKGWKVADGAVLLIDEIDKADSSVPNGLLEALGSGAFPGPGHQPPIQRVGAPPLVVITTNEERALPDAFLRRCLVLRLSLPSKSEELIDQLMARGAAHFPKCSQEVLRSAAELLAADRGMWRDRGLVPPGQAEYLDLLRALSRLASNGDEMDLLQKLAQFTFRKHPTEDETR